MGIREQIKILLFQENKTLKQIATEISEKTGKTISSSNLSHKLLRKTLKYEEAKLIGDILGYDLKFIKRK